jgi:hypothetical protein
MKFPPLSHTATVNPDTQGRNEIPEIISGVRRRVPAPISSNLISRKAGTNKATSDRFASDLFRILIHSRIKSSKMNTWLPLIYLRSTAGMS